MNNTQHTLGVEKRVTNVVPLSFTSCHSTDVNAYVYHTLLGYGTVRKYLRTEWCCLCCNASANTLEEVKHLVEFRETGSNYLKANDISENNRVVKVVGNFKYVKKWDKEKLECEVELAGVKKLWTLNDTTGKACKKAWGKEMDNWKGKDIIIAVADQNVRGTMRKVMIGTPVK